MSDLAYTCPPIYDNIKKEVEDLYHIHHFITEEEYEEQVEQMYNQDTYSGRVETIEMYGELNDDILMIDYTFDIVKCVMDICEKDYGYTHKLTTFEKTLDLYAYFCAKEIMGVMITEHRIGEKNPDKDYTHHNDEDDMELC
jgi:hypothetical protein